MQRRSTRPGSGVAAVLLVVLVSAVLAVAVHEAAHVAVARRYGGRLRGLVVRPPFLAVRIEQAGMPARACALVALAGPAGDLGLLACALALAHVGVLDRTACVYASLWPAASALCNLLPIPRADGWRALHALRALPS